MKQKYFKFYVAYYEMFENTSIFSIKKLLKALCEYSEYGFKTIKLNKKNNATYEFITRIMEKERLHFRNLGKKSSKKRWGKNNVSNEK